MFPRLFSLDGFTLHTYGVLVATGFLVGIFTAQRMARRFGLNPDLMFNLAVYLALSAMVGAKLFLILQDWRFYVQQPRQLFTLALLQSAGIFYGGLIGALAVLFWFVYRHHLSWLGLGDCLAPGAAIGHAIGRLGCFSAGCCWGRPTNAGWGITFTNPYSNATVGVPLGIRLYPTQLIESGAELLIFLLLLYLARRRRFTGELVATYLLAYGLVRFFVDILRSYEPEAMLFHGTLTAGQLTSLVMIALAIGIWVRRAHLVRHAVPATSH